MVFTSAILRFARDPGREQRFFKPPHVAPFYLPNAQDLRTLMTKAHASPAGSPSEALHSEGQTHSVGLVAGQGATRCAGSLPARCLAASILVQWLHGLAN